jgi:hypothetical protein
MKQVFFAFLVRILSKINRNPELLQVAEEVFRSDPQINRRIQSTGRHSKAVSRKARKVRKEKEPQMNTDGHG